MLSLVVVVVFFILFPGSTLQSAVYFVLSQGLNKLATSRPHETFQLMHAHC